MPDLSPFTKLIVVAALALVDIVDFIWGIGWVGLKDEQIVGVIVTALLGAASMLGISLPKK